MIPLLDLEQTHHEEAAPFTPSERMEGLESTFSPATPTLAVPGLPELERTHLPPAAAAPSLPMEDLELSQFAPVGAPTPASSGASTCRYCKYVQLEGLLCERCGMRLPRAAVPSVETSSAEEDEAVSCSQCGTKTRPGRSCASCGNRVRAEE